MVKFELTNEEALHLFQYIIQAEVRSSCECDCDGPKKYCKENSLLTLVRNVLLDNLPQEKDKKESIFDRFLAQEQQKIKILEKEQEDTQMSETATPEAE